MNHLACMKLLSLLIVNKMFSLRPVRQLVIIGKDKGSRSTPPGPPADADRRPGGNGEKR